MYLSINLICQNLNFNTLLLHALVIRNITVSDLTVFTGLILHYFHHYSLYRTYTSLLSSLQSLQDLYFINFILTVFTGMILHYFTLPFFTGLILTLFLPFFTGLALTYFHPYSLYRTYTSLLYSFLSLQDLNSLTSILTVFTVHILPYFILSFLYRT